MSTVPELTFADRPAPASPPPAPPPVPTDAGRAHHLGAPPARPTPSAPDDPPAPPPAVMPPGATPPRQGRPPVPVAAWVAGLGALLLLAAAATFLAMQWDALGATARIAVVGGVTAAAVVGGARLRGPLPVVGSVVFHLGALLLPIDALGLTIQLGAPGWVRWMAVGVTAVVTLPIVAVAGRAPLLGLAALAGVPIAATGWAMVAGPAPALVVAGVGLVLLPLADRHAPFGLVPLRRHASIVLPVTAVVVAVLVEILAVLPTGGVAAAAAAAGWLSDWPVRAVVAVLVTATLAVRARAGDARLVAVAIGTAVLALLHLVLPEATPRAVRLWTPAIVWLSVEAVTLAVGRAASGGRALRRAAAVAELLAAPLAMLVLVLVIGPSAAFGADDVLAGLVLLAAGAWSIAALRLHRDRVASAPVLLVLLAVWHVLGAMVLLGTSVVVTTVVAVAVALLPVLLRLLRPRPAASPASLTLDLSAAFLLLLAAGGLADESTSALLVALVAPLAALPLLRPLADRGMAVAGGTTAVASLLLLLGVGALADVGVGAADLPGGVVGLIIGVTGLSITLVTGGCRPIAEAGRLVATVAGLLTVLPAGWVVPLNEAAPAAAVRSVDVLGLGVGGLLPAAFLGLLLLLDAADDRGAVAATGTVLVLLRAATVGALAAGADVEVAGAVLLTIGTAAALSVAVGARSLARAVVLSGAVSAALTITVGWVLLGDAAVLRSAALLTAGALAVLLGLTWQRHALAHTGAAIATLGTWSLLAELDSTALDLWLLPVAVQSVLAGSAARRGGEVSSWLAYVPGLLLVGVPALLERLTGGSGWHGVLAGVLAVAAVILGGRFQLRGPLVVGAVLVVAVVVVETLTVVVGLPTWAWLTVGGVALLLAAASIERLGRTPGEAARTLAAGLRDPRPS